MARHAYNCNNCAVEPCIIRDALRTEPFGDIIKTHQVKCKFHVYVPKTASKPDAPKEEISNEEHGTDA